MAHKTYIRHTDGDTAVLFIHGFLGSPEHFEKFIPWVPDDCAVYNILLKGHGGSVRDFADASMQEWKNQVDGVIGELAQKYKSIIIAAHSMGTFFAMDAAVKYPDKIKVLFLLGIPLKIAVKPEAVSNTFKSFFNLISEDDAGRAYKKSHSIRLTKRLWEYIGWLPRYRELFAESKRGRETILKVEVPCCIFQSANDELVSMESVKFIPEKPNISLFILQNSAHFIYSDGDFAQIKSEFGKLFD